MIRELLLKVFIPVSRIYDKTTFSYFPGMFENPAPANYYFKKKIKNIMKY